MFLLTTQSLFYKYKIKSTISEKGYFQLEISTYMSDIALMDMSLVQSLDMSTLLPPLVFWEGPPTTLSEGIKVWDSLLAISFLPMKGEDIIKLQICRDI